MLFSLRFARLLAASCTLCGLVLSSTAHATTTAVPLANMPQIKQAETVILDQTPRVLLAHHEGSIGASQQLLTAGPAGAGGGPLTKSLWGNMILSMAIQQDAQVQKIGKKLGRMSGLLFSSVGVISALSLAQGIDGIVTLQDEPHPYHPSILGIVGSSLSVLSVGTQAAMGHHYKKQLLSREDELAHEVEHLLADLKSEGINEHVTGELIHLIGEEASSEFLALWQAVHPLKIQ
jgi:hypothetical protein